MFEEGREADGAGLWGIGSNATHPALSQAADSTDEGQRQFPRARPSPSD